MLVEILDDTKTGSGLQVHHPGDNLWPGYCLYIPVAQLQFAVAKRSHLQKRLEVVRQSRQGPQEKEREKHQVAHDHEVVQERPVTQRVSEGRVAQDVTLFAILGALTAEVGKVQVEENEPGEEDGEPQRQKVHHPTGDDAVEPFFLVVLIERLEPRVEVAYAQAAADLALEKAVAVWSHGARLVVVLLLVFLLDHGRELRVVVLLHAPRGIEQLAERRHGGLRSNVARGPLGTRVPTF